MDSIAGCFHLAEKGNRECEVNRTEEFSQGADQGKMSLVDYCQGYCGLLSSSTGKMVSSLVNAIRDFSNFPVHFKCHNLYLVLPNSINH